MLTSIAGSGMQEGGLCLWECQESKHHESSFSHGRSQAVCQRPTYTTECHGTADMAGPVVAVATLPHTHAPSAGQ